MTQWEVYAVRYAARTSRRQESFLRYYVYGEPDGPLQFDYYFWILRNGDEAVLVDTGIDVALQRPGRELLIKPLEALAALGLDRAAVSRIVISHCHSDHIGSLSLFPDATLLVQRRELEFWQSAVAGKQQFATTVKPEQLDYLSQRVHAGSAVVIDGDHELTDGISTTLVSGHSPGQQIVVVDTAAGSVVLASDAMHFYEELERELPFSVLWNLAEVYQTYDLLNQLEAAGAVLVPGHDPLVMQRFAAIPASEHIARIA